MISIDANNNKSPSKKKDKTSLNKDEIPKKKKSSKINN